MSPNITQSGRQLSESDIVTLEKEINVRLPEDYRKFLLDHNGGRPKYEHAFPVENWESNPDTGLTNLLGVDMALEANNILWFSETLKDRVPKKLVPIAVASCGNLVLLSVNDSDFGTVYLWDHDDEHSPPTFRNAYRVAGSFDEFMGSLYEFKPQWETPIAEAVRKDDVAKLEQLLDANVDLETTDIWSRTLMENASLANSLNVMRYLFARGASLRNSRTLVEGNLALVPELAQALVLLRQMEKKQ